MDKRIAPPKEFEEMLDRLTEPPLVFDTKQKAMMFAAALGRRMGKRTAIEKRGTAIRFDIFERALDDGFVDALATETVADLRVLSEARDEERVLIFEEYAHAGLKEIERVCFKQPGDPLHNLLRLTDDVRAQDPAIPGMDPNVLKNLVG